MVEIIINEKKYCDLFTINGEAFGDGITGFDLKVKALEESELILYIADEKLDMIVDKMSKTDIGFITEKWVIGQNIIKIPINNRCKISFN
jgi:hypothetical protein